VSGNTLTWAGKFLIAGRQIRVSVVVGPASPTRIKRRRNFQAAVLASLTWFPQTSSELNSFLSQRIGLSQDQIAAIQNGQPFAKNMDSRSPAEIFVFGVISINAAPESYVKFASDFNRLSRVPGFLAMKRFSTPPQLSDLRALDLAAMT